MKEFTPEQFPVCIPYHVMLSKPNAWNRDYSQAYAWTTIRGHYLFYHLNAPQELKKGPIIGTMEAPQGVKSTETISISQSLEIVDEWSTIEELLEQQQSIRGCMAGFSAKIKSPGGLLPSFEIGPEIRADLSHSLGISLRESMGQRSCRTTSYNISRDRKIEYEGGSRRCVVFVYYQPVRYDISIDRIDYLDVFYSKSAFSVKNYRRTKVPTAATTPRGKKRPQVNNELRFDHPVSLATLTLWRPVPGFPSIVRESDYMCEVDRPFDLTLSAPDEAIAAQWASGKYRPREAGCETLWELAEKAWPHSKAPRSYLDSLP